MHAATLCVCVCGVEGATSPYTVTDIHKKAVEMVDISLQISFLFIDARIFRCHGYLECAFVEREDATETTEDSERGGEVKSVN